MTTADVIASEDTVTGCGPLLDDIRSGQRPLRHKIFDHVRGNGRAARSYISRALDISPGSATTLTADLIAEGFLREVEGFGREQARGRPPVLLEVVPEAGLVIGIKLSSKRHSAVLVDFAGNVITTAELGTHTNRRSINDLLNEVDQLITRLLDRKQTPRSQIRAVGIGMSGIIDYETATVPWSPMLLKRDVDFGRAFAMRFGIPLCLDNDTNTLTLAELWFGAGRAKNDFAVVTVENGVGMGLVLGNRLYRGARGMGLELGHTKVQIDGALCRCGQRGCLEAYISDYALAREAAIALDRAEDTSGGPESILQALHSLAKTGHAPAQKIFERAGRYLSLGLSNVIQLFDPELIILSGERMQYDFLYAAEVIAEMEELTLSDARGSCTVETHRWDDLIWARGAAALALSSVTDKLIGKEGATA